MSKHKVIGPRRVAGVNPGGTVDLGHLNPAQVAALVKAGHVEAVPEPKRPRKPKDAEATAEPDDGDGD